ncbi:hypothetical protein GN241_10990 [Rhodobacteraceae bacterium IMCC1335]
MRPRYSIDTPPPDYPDFVAVLAGEGVWFVDLERSRMNALAEVDQIHARQLRQLTGNATIEERDTWAPKANAARALLAGTAYDAQAAMVGFEAAQRGISAEELAHAILARAAAFEQLIGVASAIRTKARAAFKAAETLDEMLLVGQALYAEADAAIAQISAAQVKA